MRSLVALAVAAAWVGPTAAGAQKPPAQSPAKPASGQKPAASGTEDSASTFPTDNRQLGAITALAVSPDGKRLAIGAFGQVSVFEPGTWEPVELCRQVDETVRALAFHPDGKTLAIGSGLPGRSGRVILWELGSSARPKTLPAQLDTIESIAFGKDGKEMVVGASDNKVRYFAALPAETSLSLDEHNGRVQAVACSPKENFVFVTGGLDRIVKVWNSRDHKVVINFDQSEGGITGLAFLPNGSQFVGSSLDGKLRWWQINHDTRKNSFSGGQFRVVEAHNGGVFALAFSADGKRMITSGADRSVIVWDANGGGRVRQFAELPLPCYAVALSPDGKTAYAGGPDGLLRAWDVEANKLVHVLAPKPLPPPPPEAKTGPASRRTTRPKAGTSGRRRRGAG